jgi:hypothetical protein
VSAGGYYRVREPHEVQIDTIGPITMYPVVHRNNIGVGNAIAWCQSERLAAWVAKACTELQGREEAYRA